MLDRYPMDDIMENTNCELHFRMKNISMKVEDAVAFTNPPKATFHCNPIPASYARVLVDEVVDLYSGLQLDILEVTMSTHWERPYIVSSYGESIASSLEGHRHRITRLLVEV